MSITLAVRSSANGARARELQLRPQWGGRCFDTERATVFGHGMHSSSCGLVPEVLVRLLGPAFVRGDEDPPRSRLLVFCVHFLDSHLTSPP